MKLRFSALPTIILRAGAALTLLVTAFAPPRACAQNAADGYAPQIAGRINTIVVQPDGKALIGGEMNQADCHRVCRLLADGRVDTSFTASGIDGNVEAIAVQADGKVLIGGYFSSVGGAPRMRLARLNASGSLDTGFVGPVLTGAGGTAVKDFSVQADGKVMVAGSFDTVGGTARKGVARLNSNGSLDASFIDPALNGGVSSLLRQSDGTLLLGGSFTSVGGQTGHSIVRLDANGNIDPTYSAPAFSIGADVGIWKLAVQADGKVLVGGSFTHVAGQPHARLVRLDANGGLDDSFFDPLIDSMVTSLLVQPDGAILIGGGFNSVGGQPRGHVARITADGVIDLSFRDPAFNNWVGALALQPDAKLLVTGDFDQIGGVPHDRLARLNSTGGIDTNFTDTGANGYVYALAAQTDDKLLVGGDFTSLSGYNRHGIARLKTNGAVDTDFLYLDVQGGEVLSLTLQSDGRVLAGGDFTAIGGQPRSHLARFNSSGVLDTSFADPLVSGAVYAVDTLSLDR
ncbi:MAG TPA: delta-60 repeat domain-containing protein, partial [Rhodanobacteraceae bacterium]|nr:delta-60 repeat domain-containing protein [Rhodanobacteraceae bacterium]